MRRLPRPIRVAAGERSPLPNLGWLYVCGIGHENAARAATELLHGGAQRLLSWGVAGALAADLKSGALVLPDVVFAADGNRYAVDKKWRACVEHSLRALNPASGGLAESARVASVADKQALYARTTAIAVDMESAAVAAVAAEAGLPFIAIRAIVDQAERPIPAAALRAMDEDGKPNPLRLMRRLAADPRQLPAVLHLALSMRNAQSTLVQAAAAALDAL